MPSVKCSVDGCNTRLQPLLKPVLRDRDTWVYPECDVCFRPACDKHSSDLNGQVVCDRCRRDLEARQTGLVDLNLGPLSRPR